MAIDSAGNINIAWWDDSPGYWAAFFSRSIDGGVTFSTPQNLSNDPSGTSPPNIAVDSAGNIYVVWASDAGGGFLTRSSDGSNFSTPVRIANNIGGPPTIALGPDGSIDLGWVDGSRFENVFFGRSTDGGATFSTPVLISTTNPFGGTPMITVDSSSNIDMLWEGCFSYCQIWFSRSTDGGATFSAQFEIQGVLEARSPIDMGLGPSGDINVVFNTVPFGNVFLARSTDGGGSFIKTNVSNNMNVPHSITPRNARIGVDSADNIDVVWDDSAGDLYFSRSIDQGATFSSSIIPNGIVYNAAPRIAVDASANINLVWTGVSSSSDDVFFSRSTDGGTTFSTPQKLSNNTGNSSPMPQITLDCFGSANVSWVDFSPGNADIFFTRGVLQIPPNLPKKIPALP
jgi:hypothetical protein